MTRGAADIRREAAREKAVLFEKGARQMVKGRCEATIALAELEQSRGYFDLGFESVQKLAATLSALEPREVSEMLWVGRKLLGIPELKQGFVDGRLSWTAVRLLVPHITAANAPEWVQKATDMSAGRLEREISNQRNKCIGGGPMKPLFLSLAGYKRFEQLANGLRKEGGENDLPDEECLMRLFDEIEGGREARRLARLRASGATTRTSAPVAAAPADRTPPPAVETVVPAAKCATRSRHIPASIRRQVMNRARHVCEICGNRHGLEVHHKKRFSEDGPHSLENLMAVCHSCHVEVDGKEPCEAPPPVEVCERAPVEKAEDRVGGEGEPGEDVAAEPENSAGSRSRDVEDLSRPSGDASPSREGTRLDPSRREGAADTTRTRQFADGAHPGGP